MCRRSCFHAVGLSLALVTLGLAACQTQQPEPPAPAARAYAPVATIKDLMQSTIDKSADDVWLSVTSIHTDKGIIETVPKTEEEWNKVRFGGLALAEAANLLIMPGRKVARPGEKSETPGVELEPEEMQVLIEKDWQQWTERAMALHDAAMDIVAAVDARSPEKVFEVGEHIELACEGCHSTYWYPNEKIPDLPPEVQTAPVK